MPAERSVAQIDRIDELLRDFECEYAARSQQFADRLQIIKRPQEVLEDVMQLAEEGILETTWTITGALTPVENGRAAEVRSVVFTLVHPGSTFAR